MIDEDRLEGWGEIAAFIRRSPKTAQRWEHRLGMPVRRMPASKGNIVYASRAEISEWREARSVRSQITQRVRQQAPSPPSLDATPPARRERRTRTSVVAPNKAVQLTWPQTVILALTLVGLGWWLSLDRAAAPQIVPETAPPLPVSTTVPRGPTIPIEDFEAPTQEALSVRGTPPLYFDVVAYLRFDEVGGLLANDSSGNGHDGLISGAERGRGLSGGALWFDGIDDFVRVLNQPSLEVRGAVTIEAVLLCDPSIAGGYLPVVQKAQPGLSATGYSLFFSTGCTVNTQLVEHPTVPPGSWHQIAWQHDGTIARLFIDGALVREAEPGKAQPATASNADLLIGGSPIGGGFFKGAIDEVRISRGIVEPRDFIPFCPGEYVRLIQPDGSQQLFERLQQAIDQAGEGARIFVGTGAYEERPLLRAKRNLEIITRCGAKIQGFDISSSYNVTVQGFEIDASGYDSGVRIGGLGGRTEVVNIYDTHIHSARQDGITVGDGSYQLKLTGNTIRNNGRHGIAFEAERGEHYLVRYNMIFANGDDGMNLGGAQNFSINDNTVWEHPNGYAIGRDRFPIGARTRRITLANNKFVNNSGAIIPSTSSADLENFDQYLDAYDENNATTCGCERSTPGRIELTAGWILIRDTGPVPARGDASGGGT